MEQTGNIIGPKYAIRVGDLRHWHVVTATCLQCRHTAEMTGDFLAWEQSEHAFLTDLERKLRCTRGGNREANTLSLRAMGRN